MSSMKVRAAISLLTLQLTSAFASSPVTATLTLVPDATLPGTPVSFVVVLDNPTDTVHRIGDSARLTVTTATGTFDALGIGGRTAIAIPSEQMDRCGAVACLEVPAHGRRQLYIDMSATLAGNEFFADRRLSMPASYLLQLTLDEAAAAGAPAAVRTNSATLRVLQPVGVDLAVWQRLLQLSGGNGWGVTDWILSGNAIASEIRANYPSSSYVPWVAGMGTVRTPESAIAQLDAALAANPPVSLRDDLLLVKGLFAAQASGHALEIDRDIDRALTFADTARSTLALLHDVAISDVMRTRANDALSHLYTRRTAEEALRQFASDDPPAPLKVAPHIECVTRGAGSSFTARFGYSNPNAAMKVLPVSNLNEITPAPRDQGQPRVFRPGNQFGVFVASSPGGNLIWHLDGSVAEATANFPVQCQN
jgi:hypothetical protein